MRKQIGPAKGPNEKCGRPRVATPSDGTDATMMFGVGETMGARGAFRVVRGLRTWTAGFPHDPWTFVKGHDWTVKSRRRAVSIPENAPVSGLQDKHPAAPVPGDQDEDGQVLPFGRRLARSG